MVPRCLQLLDDHGVPIADTQHPGLQKLADTDLIGPDSKPTDDMDRATSMAVPLERQISFKFPTVITPSEQAEDLRHVQTDEDGGTEQVLTAKQAATAYAGESNHGFCHWFKASKVAHLSPAHVLCRKSSSMLGLLSENMAALLQLTGGVKYVHAVDI